MGSMVLGGGFDVVGDEDGFTVGAGPALQRAAQGVRVPTPRWMNGTTSQGVTRPQEEMDWCPFEDVTMTGATALSGYLLAEPQRPFRGERLVLNAIDLDDGSDVMVLCRIDPALYVGATQIGSAQGGTPFTTFRENAFGVRLSFPAAGQGTKIKLYFRIAVNASTAGIQLGGTIIGRAVR